MARVIEHEWDVDDFSVERLHPQWHRDAACRGMGPEIFYPESNETSTRALEVCGSCPVREFCDEAGEKEHHGVWGGRYRNDLWVRRRIRSLKGVK